MNPLLTSSLLTILLQASLLVTGAWLLLLTQHKTSAARRSAACRLTMAAVLGLAALTAGKPLLSLTPVASATAAPVALPQGSEAAISSLLLDPVVSLPSPPILPAPPSLPADSMSSGPWRLEATPARWLAAAWLTGALMTFLTWPVSLAARFFLLRRSQNITGAPWLVSAGQKVKGWRLVHEVRLIPGEVTPCVWGIRHPVLALPASATTWPAAKLNLILAHECAHLLRRDPLWQIIARLFLALLWFHPLAWNLARRSRAADEQAADDTVLNADANAPAYAGLLVECARQFSLPPALQATASAMASPSTLTHRVEAVLNPATDRRPAGSACLAACALAISLLTAAACLAGPPIEITPPAPPAPKTPESTPDPAAPPAVPASEEPSKIFDPPIPPSTVPQRIADDPAPAPAGEAPAETAPETPDPPRKTFEWKPVSMNGFDYLPVSQIKAFYQFPRHITEESGTFFLRSPTMVIKGAIGSPELFVNNVKFLLKLPVQPSDDGPLISRQDLAFLFDPIIRPTYIEGFEKTITVVIDPGHGGNDPGGKGPYGKESDYALDTAQRLQTQLKKFGFRVILTRQDDSFLSLNERTSIAAAAPDAVFISLHFNTGPASMQGLQTYYPEPPGPGVDETHAAYYAACVGLATAVHANSLYKLRNTDGGVRSAGFTILSGQRKTPAILVEGGYLSNPDEAGRIGSETYRQTLAEAIAGGVQNYIKARSKRSKKPD